jgi:hypothetical protein
MMQRLPCSQDCLNDALPAISSNRALLVEYVSLGVLANQGIKPHWPAASWRSEVSPAMRTNGPGARGKISSAHHRG